MAWAAPSGIAAGCPGSVPGPRRRLDWLGTSRIEVVGSRFAVLGHPQACERRREGAAAKDSRSVLDGFRNPWHSVFLWRRRRGGK